MIITIDGPVASGKSSVAQALAKKLGFYYLNTGMLYRAVAYVLMQRLGKSFSAQTINQLSDHDLRFVHDFSYAYQAEKPIVFYQGQDLSPLLPDAALEQPASLVSVHKPVRQALLTLQRSIAEKNNIVADGRDCGTIVFPHAEFKFFLTADVDVRAQRLFHDARRKQTVSLQAIKAGLLERDKRDHTRKEAPLKVADGAVIIDNSNLTFDQTVEAFLHHIKSI